MAIRFASMECASGLASMGQSSGRAMGKSYRTGAKLCKSRETVASKTEKFLRNLYPIKTAQSVSADTGIPATNISKWLTGSSAPNAAAILTLIDTYEVDFLTAVMPRKAKWLVDAERGAELRRIKAERAALDARAEALGRC